MAACVLTWRGSKGGQIGVGFDDEHFSLSQMREEIDSVRKAHPNLPDEVPAGTSFVFAKEGKTGHLLARFKVGDTVYRNLAQHSLHRLWDGVDLIDQLLRPLRHEKASFLIRRLDALSYSPECLEEGFWEVYIQDAA